jgi:hypothetical protein
MATKKTAKIRPAVTGCPNPRGRPYSLSQLTALLEDKAFAKFFFDLLKRAEGDEKEAIECVNTYLDPTDQELQNLGIPEARWSSLKKCTDSGLLVLVMAQQNAQ